MCDTFTPWPAHLCVLCTIHHGSGHHRVKERMASLLVPADSQRRGSWGEFTTEKGSTQRTLSRARPTGRVWSWAEACVVMTESLRSFSLRKQHLHICRRQSSQVKTQQLKDQWDTRKLNSERKEGSVWHFGRRLDFRCRDSAESPKQESSTWYTVYIQCTCIIFFLGSYGIGTLW